MAEMYEVLDKLLKEKDISGAKMSEDLGMSKSFMTELRKGRAKSIKIETAQKVADYFGVSIDFLLGNQDKEKTTTANSGGFSEKDVRLVVWFNSLPEEKQKAILSLGGAPEDLAE